MKKIITIYICDTCEKKLGEKQHLSIVFAKYSGWVRKNKDDEWKHLNDEYGIKHFCSSKCLAECFEREKNIDKNIKKLLSK